MLETISILVTIVATVLGIIITLRQFSASKKVSILYVHLGMSVEFINSIAYPVFINKIRNIGEKPCLVSEVVFHVQADKKSFIKNKRYAIRLAPLNINFSVNIEPEREAVFLFRYDLFEKNLADLNLVTVAIQIAARDAFGKRYFSNTYMIDTAQVAAESGRQIKGEK